MVYTLLWIAKYLPCLWIFCLERGFGIRAGHIMAVFKSDKSFRKQFTLLYLTAAENVIHLTTTCTTYPKLNHSETGVRLRPLSSYISPSINRRSSFGSRLDLNNTTVHLYFVERKVLIESYDLPVTSSSRHFSYSSDMLHHWKHQSLLHLGYVVSMRSLLTHGC